MTASEKIKRNFARNPIGFRRWVVHRRKIVMLNYLFVGVDNEGKLCMDGCKKIRYWYRLSTARKEATAINERIADHNRHPYVKPIAAIRRFTARRKDLGLEKSSSDDIFEPNLGTDENDE